MDDLDDFITLNEQTVGQLSGLLEVADGGYAWDTGLELAVKRYPVLHHSGTTWLVPGENQPQRMLAWRRYPAFTDPRCRELHRTFARLGDLPQARRAEGYRRFANRFGFLGGRETLVPLRPRGSQSTLSTATGESLVYWHDAVSECAAVVGIWDLVQRDDHDRLARHVAAEGTRGRDRRISLFVAWDDSKPKNQRLTTDRNYNVAWRMTTYGPEAEAIADERDTLGPGPYFFSAFPGINRVRPDVVEVARMFVYSQVSKHLFNQVGVALRAERQDAQALTLVPRSLIGAIYLHFARQLSGHTAPGIPCGNPRCERLVSPDWGRKHCNDQCRDMARYHRNKGKAKTRENRPQTGRNLTAFLTAKPANFHGRRGTK